jgi:hypothetical protein
MTGRYDREIDVLDCAAFERNSRAACKRLNPYGDLFHEVYHDMLWNLSQEPVRRPPHVATKILASHECRRSHFARRIAG